MEINKIVSYFKKQQEILSKSRFVLIILLKEKWHVIFCKDMVLYSKYNCYVIIKNVVGIVE